MCNILVLDDHKAVCEGIASLVGNLETIRNAFTAFNCNEAMQIIKATKWMLH